MSLKDCSIHQMIQSSRVDEFCLLKRADVRCTSYARATTPPTQRQLKLAANKLDIVVDSLMNVSREIRDIFLSLFSRLRLLICSCTRNATVQRCQDERSRRISLKS